MRQYRCYDHTLYKVNRNEDPSPRPDRTFYLPVGRLPLTAGVLAITLTCNEESCNKAAALLNRRYAWRGYGSNHKLSGCRHETTFIAHFNGILVATVSLATDSDHGLSIDTTFPKEMEFLRKNSNTILCEIKKFAMECNTPSMPVIASLFHFIFAYGMNNLLATDLVIEINPRHASFYKNMLNFKHHGAIRTNISVNAPSQLMRLAVSDIALAVDNSQANAYRRTLYKYFYPREFEDGLVRRFNEFGLKDELEIWKMTGLATAVSL